MNGKVVSEPINVDRMRTDFDYFCHVLSLKADGDRAEISPRAAMFFGTIQAWDAQPCFVCSASRDNDHKVAFVKVRRQGPKMVPVCSQCATRYN